ncbi:hypothetical protein U1Q18_041409, partial [Sarracenia purpurea var. burkii]
LKHLSDLYFLECSCILIGNHCNSGITDVSGGEIEVVADDGQEGWGGESGDEAVKKIGRKMMVKSVTVKR